MWWFAALLFLLGLSVLDIIVKSTGGPATPPPPPAPSSSKRTSTQWMARRCGSDWRLTLRAAIVSETTNTAAF